jgi:hypothetical protein
MPQILIEVKSTADTAGFTKTSTASANLQKSLGDLGGRLEHMFSGRHLATAVATSFGLNMEKIAEHIARFFTGMSEEEEKAYKNMESLGEKAADLAIKNMKARLSNEELLRMALYERAKLQFEVENSTATTAVQQEERLKKRIKLEETIAEIIDLQKKKGNEATRVEEQLTAAAQHLQTVQANPTQTPYQKRGLEIALMKDEVVLREKLLDILKSSKLEGGETQGAHDAKVTKLKEENQRLRDSLRKLEFGTPDIDRHQTTQDKWAAMNEPGGGLDGNFSVKGAAKDGAKDWVTSLQTQAAQVAAGIENTIGAAIQGITDGIEGWIEGTKSFAQGLASTGQAVLKSMLHTVAQIGAQWLVNQMLVKTGIITIGQVQDTQRASSIVKENAATAATLPLKTASAAASGISSFGLALVFGALAVALIVGLSGGFADGGFTSPGGRNDVAGVVHKGEWVAPQWMVKDAGFGQVIAGLEGARQGAHGFDMGGFTSPSRMLTRPGYVAPAAQSPRIHLYLDPAGLARAMQEHQEDHFQQIFAREMRKNS